MQARFRLVFPVLLCLLLFAAWLAYLWPAGAPLAGRRALWWWLGAELAATCALLWWLFDAAFVRRLAALLGSLRAATPGFTNADIQDPLEEAQARLRAITQRQSQQEAALGAEEHARRDVEAALRETQERYALAVRAADDGLWEWSIDSGAAYLSPRWKAMLGYAETELADQFVSWQTRIHAQDRAGVDAALQAHLNGQSARFESEHRLLHKDGGVRWVLSRATALRHASGKAYRLIGIDANITAYKRVEATLQHVADGTANALGTEFYRSMVLHFAQALNVSEVFVTECVDHPPTRVRTLACWERGAFISEEYELAPTPCQKVFETGERYFVPHDLTRHFPNETPYGFVSYLGLPIKDSHGRMLGHLVFKDDKPMDASILMDAVYRIFTARAGAEMERAQRENCLLRVAQGFTALPTARQRLAALVAEFAAYLGAREAFITQAVNVPVTRVRALCYWKEGEIAYDVEYDLAGNPCEQVYGDGKLLYWPQQLGKRWPLEIQFERESYLGIPLRDAASGRVLGHLACCDNQSMSAQAPNDDALALFAQRGRELLLAHNEGAK